MVGQLNAQCDQLWSRVRVSEAPGFTTLEKVYLVDIEVLESTINTCTSVGQALDYKVFNSCGDVWSATATLIPNISADTLPELCIPKKKLTDGVLKTFHFRDTFYLDSGSICPNLLVYYESEPINYDNIDSTGGIPGVSWVLLNTFIRNNPHLTDTNFRVIEACNGEKRFYKPAFGDPDGDSLEVKQTKVISYKSGGGLFPIKAELGFSFPFSDKLPIASFDFDIHKQTVSFTPFDTGFYALPITVTEWKYAPFFGIVKASTSYYQIPVQISDLCFPDLYYFGVFDEDTLDYSCKNRTITVPLSTKILTSSISIDGTDFKFSSDMGYPAIVKKVYIPKDTLYVDRLKIDVQFFFDGLYSMSIVKGSDQNKVFHECGYELQESDYFFMELGDCPNFVNIDLKENQIETSVYPNPFNERLLLGLEPNELSELRLLNSLGQDMPFRLNDGEGKLELYCSVPAGVYTLVVKLKNGKLQAIPLVRI